MKVAVRYQSRGGNTKAVAEAVAKAAGVAAQPVSVPLTERVDVLFLGGGIYGFGIDPALKSFIGTLKPDAVKTVAPFSTAGGVSGAPKVSEAVAAQGISVSGESLSVKMILRNNKLLGGKGIVTLSDKENTAIKDFVKKTIA